MKEKERRKKERGKSSWTEKVKAARTDVVNITSDQQKNILKIIPFVALLDVCRTIKGFSKCKTAPWTYSLAKLGALRALCLNS